MPEISFPQLSPRQIAKLESLLRADFKLVTFERFERYPAVEKEGFVALLELDGEKVRMFGTVGYHLGNGIAVLVERAGKKMFVWKNESVVATPDIMANYARFKSELDHLLNA